MATRKRILSQTSRFFKGGKLTTEKEFIRATKGAAATKKREAAAKPIITPKIPPRSKKEAPATPIQTIAPITAPKKFNIDERTGVPREEFKREVRKRKVEAETGKPVRSFEQLQAEKEQAALAEQTLEEAGAFEDVTPGEVSLAPPERFGEGIPVVGPVTAALQNILTNADRRGWIPILETDETEPFPAPMTEETLREGALRQISINSFNEGVSAAESFGAMVEAIPVVGNRARAWAGGLVEQPSTNALTVAANIEAISQEATNSQEKVRSGLMPPEFALVRARQMEETVAQLEGRLKLLIETSAVLKANTDQVNGLQSDILESKGRIDNFRTAASFALTAQLTGTGRVVPTDEQMFFELKAQNEGT